MNGPGPSPVCLSIQISFTFFCEAKLSGYIGIKNERTGSTSKSPGSSQLKLLLRPRPPLQEFSKLKKREPYKNAECIFLDHVLEISSSGSRIFHHRWKNMKKRKYHFAKRSSDQKTHRASPSQLKTLSIPATTTPYCSHRTPYIAASTNATRHR
ncbi:unnamed protein product [Ectocarpus sp. 13 AM-2016]